MKKYSTEKDETTGLLRITALRDFGNVKAGDIGGLIEKEENLSHEGNCWVYDNTQVYDDAWVSGDAQVSGDARVFGNARVYGSAVICNYAAISQNALVDATNHVITVDVIANHKNVTVYRTIDGASATAVLGNNTLHFYSLDNLEEAVKNTHDYEVDRSAYESVISLLRKAIENF
jgi:carbonic anhydrase/acetyltransferase-like protein (isoleucine patch superfamily)